MAQQAGQSEGSGKNPLGITAFWITLGLWEHWITRFTWGVIAKHSFNPTAFYFDRTLTAAQITDLPEEVNGKNRLEAEQTLISNIYLGNADRTNYITENPIWTWRLPDILGFWMNLRRK